MEMIMKAFEAMERAQQRRKESVSEDKPISTPGNYEAFIDKKKPYILNMNTKGLIHSLIW